MKIITVSRQQLIWLEETWRGPIVPAFLAGKRGFSAEYRKRFLELKAKGLVNRLDNFMIGRTGYAFYEITRAGEKLLKSLDK